MKPSSIPLLRLGSILLLATCGDAFGEEKPAIVLSPELAVNAEEVPDEANALVILERELAPLDEATTKSLTKAVEQLRVGTLVKDPALFKKLEERHLAAREVLKAPARSPRRTEFEKSSVLYRQIFKGADALAYKSSLEGDQATAIAYRRDQLEWSRLIRGSHPEFLSYLIGLGGWRDAFNGLLRDWERHPNQKAGFAEIQELLREFPCPSSELIPVYRREGQFWCDSGGSRGILEKLPRDQSAGFFLRAPFDKLTIGELLDLPYDEASEIRRQETQLLGSIEAAKRNVPLIDWPTIRIKEPTGKTLEDYRKRPNGLGELVDDYSSSLYKDSLSLILFHQPAMETCLAWLKADSEGKSFNGDSSDVKPDPVTGKPLKIELKSRRIRSVGPDLEFDKMDADEWAPGIITTDDDRVLKVPEWRKND